MPIPVHIPVYILIQTIQVCDGTMLVLSPKPEMCRPSLGGGCSLFLLHSPHCVSSSGFI